MVYGEYHNHLSSSLVKYLYLVLFGYVESIESRSHCFFFLFLKVILVIIYVCGLMLIYIYILKIHHQSARKNIKIQKQSLIGCDLHKKTQKIILSYTFTHLRGGNTKLHTLSTNLKPFLSCTSILLWFRLNTTIHHHGSQCKQRGSRCLLSL